MRLRTTLLLAACVAAATVVSQAQARPLILPVPNATPGGVGLMEIVAPQGAASCALSFRGGDRRFGPYRLSLGGPTRLVHWKVGEGASGTWTATLSCTGANRRGLLGADERDLGTRVRSIVVKRGGAPRGRLVARGSLQVTNGSIPELSRRALAANDNPLGKDEVDVRRRDERFHACSGARWVASTRTTGEGIGTAIQFEPTRAARANAAFLLTPAGPAAGLGPWESNPAYGQMWAELNRCARFSPDIPSEQRHSMYMQMACHARFGASSHFGGNTWDLEAWRKDVAWAVGLSVGGRCGPRYGNLPASTAGALLVGRIVTGRGYARSNPAEEGKAWLVLPGAFHPYRRHIAGPRAYDCLVAAGRPQVAWFPFRFLDTYAEKISPDVTEGEVCPVPTPPPTPAPPPPPPPEEPPPPPPPVTYTEWQGALGANTFTNPYNASGMGVRIEPYQYVEVSCKVYAPQIPSANPDGYWYRIYSAPWNDQYYAVANTFWNGDIPGQKPYTHNTDFNVPDC